MIGAPNGVNYKSEDLFKMGISENLQSISNVSQYNDYFYNYITLGMVTNSLFLSSYTFYIQHFVSFRMRFSIPIITEFPSSFYTRISHVITISTGKLTN